MAKPNFIELPGCEPIPILFEDRSVLAIDKPRGWMLVPHSWQKTRRNLQAAITSSIAAGDFWARSRGLKFLRHVHRLDADTSGVLLFAKSFGAVEVISDLFESRKMEKTYLAVVTGEPRQTEWTCRLKLAPDPKRIGRMKVDARHGKPAETYFKILETRGNLSLVECKPVTGRTHQIRVHLAESGLPIVGDELYGKLLTPTLSAPGGERETKHGAMDGMTREDFPSPRPRGEKVAEGQMRGFPLGLRAVRLAFVNPFTKRRVDIRARAEEFLRLHGFKLTPASPGDLNAE
ncbi:MAG TPA: RNA pseudouridine synthase [Verrucomicrobiae bacterium]|nr:RNA pseudouridine synthase [Verrucomicrobiae bacterium]